MITSENTKELTIRSAVGGDGALIWSFIKEHGGLDLNSPYCYMVTCHHHGNSCYVALQDGNLVGFLTSYYLPEHRETLFVWQVGVSPEMRGQGLATRLLKTLIKNHPDVREINTTIEPTNTASRHLFSSFARKNGFSIKSKKFICHKDFPIGMPHEDEDLYVLKKEEK